MDPIIQQSQDIPSTKKTFTPKFIAVIALLLLLGAGAVAGIWYWQTSQIPSIIQVPVHVEKKDPFADWKTYTNTQYGFEIKYPPQNNDFSPARDIGVNFLDKTQPEPGPAAFWIVLSQKIWQERLGNKNTYKFADKCSPLAEQETECIVLSLNPYAILTKVNVASPINYQYSLYVLTDKFELNIGPLPREVQSEILIQILSTFKFIAPSSAMDTSTWKTYRNTQHGYELKYPSDFELSEELSSSSKGTLLIKNDVGTITILPGGEFDHGLPFTQPVISQISIAGKNATKTFWDLPNYSGALVIYNFTDNIKDWVQCKPDLKNCNRIEYQGIKDGLLIVDQILFTFKFIN